MAKFLTALAVVCLVCLPSWPQQAKAPGTIVCDIPPELVLREGRFMVAKEVTGKVIVTVNGAIYTGTLTFPDTKVRRTGVGKMTVDACQAKGEVR
jgi:hypothetical protein